MKKFLPKTPKQAILADALCWIIATSVISTFSPKIGAIVAVAGLLAIGAEMIMLHRMNNRPISEEDFD